MLWDNVGRSSGSKEKCIPPPLEAFEFQLKWKILGEIVNWNVAWGIKRFFVKNPLQWESQWCQTMRLKTLRPSGRSKEFLMLGCLLLGRVSWDCNSSIVLKSVSLGELRGPRKELGKIRSATYTSRYITFSPNFLRVAYENAASRLISRVGELLCIRIGWRTLVKEALP